MLKSFSLMEILRGLNRSLLYLILRVMVFSYYCVFIRSVVYKNYPKPVELGLSESIKSKNVLKMAVADLINGH